MSRYYDSERRDIKAWPLLRDGLALLLVLIAVMMVGCPQYRVWRQGLVGKAELRQAEWNRQIQIQEAKAAEESAKYKAQAEINRAHGVAEANKIVADGLKGHEEYLRYLMIQAFEHVASSPNGSQVIYVPTEAMMPITEANRLAESRRQQKTNMLLRGEQEPQ